MAWYVCTYRVNYSGCLPAQTEKPTKGPSADLGHLFRLQITDHRQRDGGKQTADRVSLD